MLAITHQQAIDKYSTIVGINENKIISKINKIKVKSVLYIIDLDTVDKSLSFQMLIKVISNEVRYTIAPVIGDNINYTIAFVSNGTNTINFKIKNNENNVLNVRLRYI